MSNGHNGHDDVRNADVAHTEAPVENVSNTCAYAEMTWRREIDGKLFIKVIDFPHDCFAGESMWVEVVVGDELSGAGILRNHPTGSDLKYGNVVCYDGGTEETKPRYTGLARWSVTVRDSNGESTVVL